MTAKFGLHSPTGVWSPPLGHDVQVNIHDRLAWKSWMPRRREQSIKPRYCNF